MKNMIKMHQLIGDFAENKEVAKKLREEIILPSLSEGNEVILDFEGVEGATQSFIHALVSEPIRLLRNDALERLYYKNTNDNVQSIISVVYRYMQESLAI
ncbi:STAS-like domain-containing protein [Candidatus Saccharibacteria bacterium]|nr:STAS-like domain-containing protein [Candidatus Saccharibacteria bacterium]